MAQLRRLAYPVNLQMMPDTVLVSFPRHSRSIDRGQYGTRSTGGSSGLPYRSTWWVRERRAAHPEALGRQWTRC